MHAKAFCTRALRSSTIKFCAPAVGTVQSVWQEPPTMVWPAAHGCAPGKAHWAPFHTWPAGQACGGAGVCALAAAFPAIAATQELFLPSVSPVRHTGQGPPLQVVTCRSGWTGFGSGSLHGPLSHFLTRGLDSCGAGACSLVAGAFAGAAVLTFRSPSDASKCVTARPVSDWVGLGAADEFGLTAAAGESLEGLRNVCC